MELDWEEVNIEAITTEEEESKKKGGRFEGPTFIQIPDAQLKTRIAEMSPYSLKLFMYLSADAFEGQSKDRLLGICVKSLNELESELHMSKKTILKSIKELRTKQYIKTAKQKGCQTTVYAVNPKRAWKGALGEEGKAVYMKSLSGFNMVKGNITIEGEFE